MMSYFRDSFVEFDGQVFHFAEVEGRALESSVNYWHGPGAPSSWLAVAVFMEAQRKIQGVPNKVLLELAAKALGITVDRLFSLIEWHENYMRWRDDDPDYKVL